ncbi:MAG: S-layer homology domain-containing protein [Leptolyngbya sp.]|nr:S-layer homology domain-containing protein [Leptolyngbya sp.]
MAAALAIGWGQVITVGITMVTVLSRIALGVGAIALTLGLSSCAGSSLGEAVQRSLEPDSQLAESPPFGIDPASTPTASTPTISTPIDDPASTASTDGMGSDGDRGTSGDGSRVTAPPGDRDAPRRNPPEPGDPDFIGPVLTAGGRGSPAASSQGLAGVPSDLKPYIEDLLALDLLPLRQGADGSGADGFTQPISRREYARWLFTVNNRFYADTAAKRVRPGSRGDQPAFQDVPATDPDFAAIQGLAAAGIIPSTLTGNSTAVNFRPDTPLTRETLVLWKVPLDTRAALPTTTPAAVTETWGFQDAAKIEPLALRAIAADFQLGDFANIRRAFGYTTLLQPQKAVTRAEAAATLWRFGTQTDGITAKDVGDRP